MDYVYICNMASDYISRVELTQLKEEKITLCNKNGRVGPHGLCSFQGTLIIANSYSNSISRVDMSSCREVDSYYIGMHCNDVDIYGNEAFITCGESNNIVVFDLYQNKLLEEIPVGNLPHSIAINKQGIVAVSNMEGGTITLLDCAKRDYNKEIKVGPYPVKVLFSQDGRELYVCESNLGSDKAGTIAVLSIDNLNVIKRIQVGKSPVDMFIEESFGYVSNFSEGSISVVALNTGKEIKKIYLGGMLQGIVKDEGYLYVGDNYGNKLIRFDIIKERKKIIPIGLEPAGMILA
jgi:DNA-binding beta-propeller fold protein YncE